MLTGRYYIYLVIKIYWRGGAARKLVISALLASSAVISSAYANEPAEIADGVYDYIITNHKDTYSKITSNSSAETKVLSEGSGEFTISGTTGTFNGTSYGLTGDEDFYLDGDENFIIFNKSKDDSSSVGSITTRAQPIFDVFGDTPNEDESMSNGTYSIISGNYIKTSGKEFNIGKLNLENSALGTDERGYISSLAKNVSSIIKKDTSQVETELQSALGSLLQMVDSTYLNVTTLEFRDDEYSFSQTVKIGETNIGKYSFLRVIEEGVDKSGGDTTAYQGGETNVNFTTVNLYNLSGIGFGLFGNQTSAPQNITIGTLNVLEGGSDFAYTTLMSSKKSTVSIGAINIDSNTLDLAGTPAQTLYADLRDYLQRLGEDYSDLVKFLEKYAGSGSDNDTGGYYPQKIDAGMNNGVLFQRILDVLGIELNLNDQLKSTLKQLGEKIDDEVYGYVNGITLAGIQGSDGISRVTVQMDNSSTLSGSGPQIKIGDVADNTWVTIKFTSSALKYTNYQDGEYAVMLSGDTDNDYVIQLAYTGYSDEADAKDKLMQLSEKVGQTAKVAVVYDESTDNGGNPAVVEDNDADYADETDFTAADGKNYKRLLATVNPTGFDDTCYTYGLIRKKDENGDFTTGYVVDWKADYSEEQESGTQTPGDEGTPETPETTETGPSTGVNDAKQALLDPSVYTTMLWRVQMNNLVNRLGDLHEAKVPTGAWVRVYGGSLDFDDRHIDSDYIGVQVGADHQVGGGWTVGGALSYTDGDADYRNGGSSDAYAFDFALYGTWVHENGLYVDLVGRVGRVSNDSDINLHVCDNFIHGSDSYDATAWGLSAEVGWKVPVTEMFFIEPQAQLSYAHISSESADFGDYSADYDSIDMLIGRLGVRTGFELPDDHGSIYLRANVLQDFNGDVDSTLSYDCGSVHQKVSSDEDMDDAWFEVGLGATVKFTDNFYLYAECTYADGGDVDSVYGNLGARLMF